MSALRVYSGYRRPGADGVKLLEISPSEPLGDARDSMYWSSANVERWIDLGRKDALAVVDGAPARAACSSASFDIFGVECLGSIALGGE